MACPSVQAGSPHKSPNTVRHKVLNNNKVDMGMKRRLFDEQMDKAASNRKAHIQEVTDKASAVNARAASRAAAAKGLSAAAEAKKHAIYEKMNAADVARATVLRQRATATVSKERRDDAKAMLLVFPNQTTRPPPMALVLRLKTISRQLVATAGCRQAAAAARRDIAVSARVAAAAKRRVRVHAAAGRREASKARVIATIDRHNDASATVLAARTASRVRTVSEARRRASAAAAARAQLAHVKAAKAAKASTRCMLATERHAGHLHHLAKSDVHATRAATAAANLKALRGVQTARGEAHAGRCVQAAMCRAQLIETRVQTARRFLPEKLKAPKPSPSVPFTSEPTGSESDTTPFPKPFDGIVKVFGAATAALGAVTAFVASGGKRA